jgi:transaldolase/glucose-6-phosphate isomerase
LNLLTANDYFALLAYLPRDGGYDDALQAIRHEVRDARRVATCLGFGPRYLHSTGQLHKAGPLSGVFLMITADAAKDLAVPGRPFTFGVVEAAQALGDFNVLTQRDRRALRVHLGSDVAAGLKHLHVLITDALRGG